MERKFDVMEELGTDLDPAVLELFAGRRGRARPHRRRLVASSASARRSAACASGYEALAWGRHTSDHREAWSSCATSIIPSIGLILDSFHSLARNIPSASIGDIRVDKLFFVQIADAPWLTMDYLSWSRHFRNMPGQGDLPLAEFAEAIHRLGYPAIGRSRSSTTGSVPAPRAA